MPIRPFQTAFLAGELSPQMAARVDERTYAHSCKTLENFLIRPQGGIIRRPGTRFVGHAMFFDQFSPVNRLVPFIFSVGDARVLEMCVAGTAGSYVGGINIYGADTSGVSGLLWSWTSSLYQHMADFDPTTLFQLRWQNTADVLYFVHPDHAPFKISRYTDTSWTWTTYSPSLGPFVPENADVMARLMVTGGTSVGTPTVDTNGQIVLGVTGGCTVGTAGSWGTTIGPFSSAGVGETWKLRYNVGGTTGILSGYFTVTGGVAVDGSSAGASIVLYPDFDNPDTTHKDRHQQYAQVTMRGLSVPQGTPGSYMWSGPAWGAGTDTAGTSQGWPRCVGFHDQRLLFAGSRKQPTTMWATESGLLNSFFEGRGNDDNAYSFTLMGDQVNAIEWMTSFYDLLIGTDGGEFVATGGDSPITPNNIMARCHTKHGSEKWVNPAPVNNVTLFVQRQGRKLRELTYTFDQRSYAATDLTFPFEHITESGVNSISWQEEPYRTLWAVRNDGDLITMFYDRKTASVLYAQEPASIGAARQVTENGEFESLAIIPNTYIQEDQVWVVVNRTIGGTSKRTIEYFDASLNTDCATTGTWGSPTNVWEFTSGTGAGVLYAGQTVDVWGDGEHIGLMVMPTNKILTLGSPVSSIEVGFPFTSTLVTQPPEAQIPLSGGSIQGLQKRWVEIFARVYGASRLKANGTDLIFPLGTDGNAITTGDIRVTNLGIDRQGSITITTDEPCTILSIFGKLEVPEEP